MQADNTTSTAVLLLAVFGASTVEMVEALTIVVASGVTRGWRSALEGAAAAALVLGVIVVAVGVPLVRYVPIDGLRVTVGALLLVLGMSWLRKSALRSSGHKALHDEDAIFLAASTELSAGIDTEVTSKKRDAVGFAVAFKGVFLEGTEVVLIVVSLGASQNRLGIASAAAGAGAILVAAVGIVVSKQLSKVPENAIKTAVGIMLTSFGLFWLGEGSGVRWPGSDLAILGLIAIFATTNVTLVIVLKSLGPKKTALPSAAVVGDTHDAPVGK